MRVLVVGGQLQGMEITYLAKAAGWEVTLVDRRENALASRLCDAFLCADILDVGGELFNGYDLVFPALEDLEALWRVDQLTKEAGVPFAFDGHAYTLSQSKVTTNRFLQRLGVPIPALVQDCEIRIFGDRTDFFVKPDTSSGSKGVRRFVRRSDALCYIDRHEDTFGQEFLEGSVYSIEVVCSPGQVAPQIVTEVVIGTDFDCHRIVAPAALSPVLSERIRDIAFAIGTALDMRGIFDIEMILHDSQLFVLEIDARMPSQTPMAIYHATGINLFVETARCFLGEAVTTVSRERMGQAAVLQHVRIGPEGVEFIGEGVLSGAPPLCLMPGFGGSDMALLSGNRTQGLAWATLIATAQDARQAERRIDEVAARIAGLPLNKVLSGEVTLSSAMTSKLLSSEVQN